MTRRYEDQGPDTHGMMRNPGYHEAMAMEEAGIPADNQYSPQTGELDADEDGLYEDDTIDPHEDGQPLFYTVCVALRDKQYGGCEEGGWWYDTCDPVLDDPGMPIPVVTRTFDEAEAAADTMQAELDRLAVNEGRRPISSVLSEGVYVAHIFEGLPHPLPTTQPHYE